MQTEKSHPTSSSKDLQRTRAVLAMYLQNTCSQLKEDVSTRKAAELIDALSTLISGVSFVTWSLQADATKDPSGRYLSAKAVMTAIDAHVTQSLQACEKAVIDAQIQTLNVKTDPAARLVRDTLERHRAMLGDWLHMRAIPQTQDDYALLRSFMSSGVSLHNRTAALLARPELNSAPPVPAAQRSASEVAASVLTALLLRGTMNKDQALELVSLISDYVSLSGCLKTVSESVKPAWQRVFDLIAAQRSDIPVRELALLFPRQLAPEIPRATSADDVFLLADDYERLARSLRNTPFMLDTKSNASAIDQAYSSARANLLASSSLLRCLYDKHSITIARDVEIDDELTDADNDTYYDEDLSEPDIEHTVPDHWQDPAKRDAATDRVFVNDPQFCEVCYRTSGARKFCREHLNTAGKSRPEIREAKRLLPVYKSTLLALQKRARDPGLKGNQWIDPVEKAQATANATVTDRLKSSCQALDVLHAVAKRGIAESNRHDLDTAVASIRQRLVNVSTTDSKVWDLTTCVLTDLQALVDECAALTQIIEGVPTGSHKGFDASRLLGPEIRARLGLYAADILCRLSLVANNPQMVSLAPDEVRRDFYQGWFNGFDPQFALGSASHFQGADIDFLAARHNQSAFSMDVLWGHFSRLAAWRVAQHGPTPAKKRLRRLPKEQILEMQKQGLSVADIASRIKATPEGITAALARWEKKD